jgi:hypothetical protein
VFVGGGISAADGIGIGSNFLCICKEKTIVPLCAVASSSSSYIFSHHLPPLSLPLVHLLLYFSPLGIAHSATTYSSTRPSPVEEKM